jgi:hypothetical protein
VDITAAAQWARRRVFEIITTILAVVAIVFASVQYRDSRKQLEQSASQIKQSGEQLKKLQEITPSLQEITHSIQTIYVGDFPHNLDEINKVVQEVSDGGEIDIMTDFPGYAIYSRHDAFNAYKNKLMFDRQQKKVVVKMLVYGKLLADKALRTQFKQADFEEEKANGFRGFFERYPPAPPDYDGFISRVLQFEDEAMQQMCRERIEVRRVPPAQKYLFFVWGNNNPQAVFAFRNEATKNREISFRTVDRSLIEVFKTVFDNTWADADPGLHKELQAEEDPACRDTRMSATNQR